METCYPIQHIMSRINSLDISFNKDGHTPPPPLSPPVNVYENEYQDIE
jgi:hypothetical protein